MQRERERREREREDRQREGEREREGRLFFSSFFKNILAAADELLFYL